MALLLLMLLLLLLVFFLLPLLIYVLLYNSGFNHGATAADATAAIVGIFPLAVADLRAFMCVHTGTPTNQKYPLDHENRQNLVNLQPIEPRLGSVFIRISRTV